MVEKKVKAELVKAPKVETSMPVEAPKVETSKLVEAPKTSKVVESVDATKNVKCNRITGNHGICGAMMKQDLTEKGKLLFRCPKCGGVTEKC